MCQGVRNMRRREWGDAKGVAEGAGRGGHRGDGVRCGNVCGVLSRSQRALTSNAVGASLLTPTCLTKLRQGERVKFLTKSIEQRIAQAPMAEGKAGVT